MPESDATLADLHVARVPFAIRRCRADDLGSLEWFGEFRDHREIIERTFAQTGAGTQAMWIADVNGFPAGQLWVDLQRDRLWAARVLQPLRGCGLGSALTRRAERDLAARGRTHAAVSVETGNPCGLRFWLRAACR